MLCFFFFHFGPSVNRFDTLCSTINGRSCAAKAFYGHGLRPCDQGCWIILCAHIGHTSRACPATFFLSPFRRHSGFLIGFGQGLHHVSCVSLFPDGCRLILLGSITLLMIFSQYTNTHKSHIFSVKHSAHSLLYIINFKHLVV